MPDSPEKGDEVCIGIYGHPCDPDTGSCSNYNMGFKSRPHTLERLCECYPAGTLVVDGPTPEWAREDFNARALEVCLEMATSWGYSDDEHDCREIHEEVGWWRWDYEFFRGKEVTPCDLNSSPKQGCGVGG